MDFTLTPNATGSADLSYVPSDDLFVNVYLSLTIIQGSWWFDSSFGLKKRKRLKNTPATALLLQQDCKAALKWLIDSGRATIVEVTPVIVPELRNRLKLECIVIAADGREVNYDKFIEVF